MKRSMWLYLCPNLNELLADIVYFGPLRIAVNLTVLKHVY